jgi:NAD(P)-dependent dehydrogenase (short-subunit alcohol dehydrogenase family)
VSCKRHCDERNPSARFHDQRGRVLSVNLTGVWLCMKYEIPRMLAGGRGGAIVNMSSILGTVGFENSSAYVAAKHGVIGLSRTAALEYAGRGIRVNAVCPGFIRTPILEQAGILEGTDRFAAISALHPMGRMGTPEEVAESVLWLCSDGASFVTGHALLVDVPTPSDVADTLNHW